MEQENARLTAEIEASFDQANAADAEEGSAIRRRSAAARSARGATAPGEDRRAKIRAVREALQQETAKRRAAKLQHMADGLRP